MSGWLLALELSTPQGSVAVVCEDEAVKFEETFQSERSHNSKVFAPLDRALSVGKGLGRFLGLVVGTGPGSYTGVRIAIAAAHGVALSREVPVVGVPSLEACLDYGRESGVDYGVIGDARRGRFYLAEVRGGRLRAQPSLVAPSELPGAIQALQLSQWMTCDCTPLQLPSDAMALLGAVPTVQPQAVLLAKVALRRWGSHIPDVPLLEPYYLEGAFITEAKRR
jgi:tRNA threonylcarbamoyl adenosine modification protein YeaZ